MINLNSNYRGILGLTKTIKSKSFIQLLQVCAYRIFKSAIKLQISRPKPKVFEAE